MPAIVTVTPSGIPTVDYVDSGTKWATNSFTYSFPTSASFYVGANGTSYGSGEENSGFQAFNAVQQAAVTSILSQFSEVANLTFTEITETTTQSATIRYAMSSLPSTAWGYYPSTSPEGGDAWFGTTHRWYNNPVVGNYAWLTIMHETGHTVGLKHPQDVMGSFGAAPANVDSLEYSVMSYRSYTGASTTQGLTNATWSFPTTLMMYDIAALQYMYGANYYNTGNSTVYSWNPTTGQEFINGVAQAKPGGDTIFMTVWDGGGTNTYDFSNYSTNLSINLNPGAWTTTSSVQLANLGSGHIAIGNIANAYLYNNNPASLVQNAIGGSGNDTIIGNAADNTLTGGPGNDNIDGQGGTNTAVYSGPSADYQVTQNTNGTWTITDLRPGSPDGTDTLTNIQLLQFSDKTVAIGTVNPPPTVPAPSIASFSPDSAIVGDGITNANVLTLSGTAQANTTVKVYDGATLVGSVTANASGGWSIPTATLPDGTHTFTATATDSSGDTSAASLVMSVIVDTVAPVQPTIVLNSVDSGIVGDDITNVNVIALTGTAEINSTIKIYDGGTLLGSAVADAEGVWNFVPYVGDDQYATPPSTATATITKVSYDLGAVKLTGTADPNSTVSIHDGATGAVLGTARAKADGTWKFDYKGASASTYTFTVTATDPSGDATGSLAQETPANQTQAYGFTTGPLPDGVHNFTVTSTDAAGNVSPTSAVLSITVDTTTPTGGTPDLVAGSDSGSSNTDNLTNVTGPSFTVALNSTVAAGDTVQLLLGGSALAHNVLHTITAADVAAHSVSLSVTTGDLGTDGSKSISAKFTDVAGNSSTTSALAVTLDTTGPSETISSTIGTNTGSTTTISSGGLTKDNTLALSGTVSDANGVASVHVFDGATDLGAATIVGGNWNFTTLALTNGTHSFTAKAVDTAGNTTTTTAVTATVAAAALSETISSTIGTNTGSTTTISSGGLTKDNTLALSGTVSDTNGVASVHVFDGATDLGAATIVGGNWSLTTDPLTNGTHSFTAVATDTAGNTTTTAAVTATVDTTTPTGGTPDLVAGSDSGSSNTDNLTNVTSPSFTVALNSTVAAGDTVQLLLGGSALAHNVLHTITAADVAAHSVSLSVTTGDLGTDGSKSISAKFTDAASNSSTTSALAVTLDTTGPSETISSTIGTNTGSTTTISSGGLTKDNTLALSGTVSDTNGVASVHVFDGATDLGAATINAGSWSLTTDPLINGTHSLTAKAVDTAGNTTTTTAVTATVNTTMTVIEANGSTSLAEAANHYYLDNSSWSGPSLKYNGAAIVTGGFGAWIPIGVEQTTNGYEVAWHNTATGLYTAWNIDSNGNYVSNIIGAVSGTSTAFESFETSFHQDLNGDGVIGVATVIEAYGLTSLVQVGNNYFLDNSSGSGPPLKYAGAVVAAGQFVGSTPIGAEQTAGGYEVAWKNSGTGEYTVWSTDSSGNFVSNSSHMSGTSVALESLETSFHQDLNGDGVIGVATAIEAYGSTGLVQVGNNSFLDNSSGSGPSLKYAGAVVAAGQFVGSTPIGAEQTEGGYEVAWKNSGTGEYTVWSTGSSGNFVSNSSHMLGTSVALESLETSFHQDLNGDGVIGVPGSLASAAVLNSGSNNAPTIEVSSLANQNSSHNLTDSSSVATSLMSDTFKFTGLDQNDIHNVSTSANSESQGTLFNGVSNNSNGTDVNGVAAWNYHVNEASIHSLVVSATDSFAGSLADHHVAIPTITISVLPVLHDFHFV